MSKSNQKKKVVVTTSQRTAPTVSRGRGTSSSSSFSAKKSELIFGKSHYRLMLLGIGLIALGMVLMSGGAMPSPDVWDESIIYSKRRTLVGPLVIILGLVVEIVAIFHNASPEHTSEGLENQL